MPKTDRLIVDDAFWVDLVRDGRDRRNVVWAYKVDTDEQVQGWAPDGWTDYEWVVSTASLRANMPRPVYSLTRSRTHNQRRHSARAGPESRCSVSTMAHRLRNPRRPRRRRSEGNSRPALPVPPIRMCSRSCSLGRWINV